MNFTSTPRRRKLCDDEVYSVYNEPPSKTKRMTSDEQVFGADIKMDVDVVQACFPNMLAKNSCPVDRNNDQVFMEKNPVAPHSMTTPVSHFQESAQELENLCTLDRASAENLINSRAKDHLTDGLEYQQQMVQSYSLQVCLKCLSGESGHFHHIQHRRHEI